MLDNVRDIFFLFLRNQHTKKTKQNKTPKFKTKQRLGESWHDCVVLSRTRSVFVSLMS